jgi:hypothetical protein
MLHLAYDRKDARGGTCRRGSENWKTVYNRHRRWSGDGTWEMILDRLRAGCGEAAGAAWTAAADAAVVRAHQHTAGARRVPPADVDPARLAVGALSGPGAPQGRERMRLWPRRAAMVRRSRQYKWETASSLVGHHADDAGREVARTANSDRQPAGVPYVSGRAVRPGLVPGPAPPRRSRARRTRGPWPGPPAGTAGDRRDGATRVIRHWASNADRGRPAMRVQGCARGCAADCRDK